jgi:hypothetical protein
VKLNKYILTGIILYIFHISVIAQEDGKISLRSILNDLEDRYEISFTYVDEDIEGIYLQPPSDDISLSESIQYLTNITGLDFQQLSDRFVTISQVGKENIEICGVLVDRKEGGIIHGATIQGPANFTVSNEHGGFRLTEITIEDTILVRYLGYEYLIKPVYEFSENKCDTLRLNQEVRKLKELVIANFISHGIAKDAEGVYTIDAETLEILPGLTDPDVLHTIQYLPGIISIDETVSDINVRGGTNDQNLILWEGIKMYQSGHFFGLISAFNPYITDKVGLTKNGSSTYLGDAVSSTLNIETDHQVRQNVSGSAGMNMINADANINIPLFKKSSLQLSARRSIADLIETPTYKSYFDRVFRNTEVLSASDNPDSLINSNENFEFYDLSANFNYNITSKDKVELSFLRIYNDIEYQESAVINGEDETKTSGLEQSSMAAGLVYNRLWNEKLRTNAQIYLSDYRLGAVNFDLFNQQRLIQENEVLEKGLKLDSRYIFSDKFDLFGGYQLTEVGIGNLVDINNPIYRRYIKRVLLSHALFAELNYLSNSGKTKLRGGLRVNYFQKFVKWSFEPRLAFNQQFLKYFSLEILGEFKSQTAAQIIDLQNDFLGVEKRRWVLANDEDIPIMYSKQLSSGIHFQKSGILISVEGYIKKVKGITSSSQGFQNQFEYIRSTGDYEIYGLDFLFNKRLGNFNLWLSYSLAKNEYYFPEFTPSVFPNNIDVRHIVSGGASYHTRKFQLSTGMNWRTGKPYTEPLSVSGGEILYYPPNTSRLDAYLRVDISAKYKIRISNRVGAELGASIWNLLNKQNILNIFYKLDSDSEINEVQQYALGFTPNIMFRINF